MESGQSNCLPIMISYSCTNKAYQESSLVPWVLSPCPI